MVSAFGYFPKIISNRLHSIEAVNMDLRDIEVRKVTQGSVVIADIGFLICRIIESGSLDGSKS